MIERRLPPRVDTLERRRLVAVLLVASVLATGIAGGYFQEAGRLDAELEVVAIDDPNGLGRGTTVTLLLTNRESAPIRPAFNVITTEHQTRFYYRIRSGPSRLGPGETGVYVVRAPAVAAAPPPGATVLVTANDAGTQRRVRAEAVYRDSSSPPVTNPRFAYWSPAAGGAHERPVGWTRAASDHGTERVTVRAAGRRGATLRVDDVSARGGPWAMAGLQQQVPLPRSVRVSATPGTLAPSEHRLPPAAVGVELADGDRRVWVVFADVPERTVVERHTRSHEYAIVNVPATAGQRSTATVNVTRVYRRMAWPVGERRVNLLAFVATYPSESQRPASATFHRVNATA